MTEPTKYSFLLQNDTNNFVLGNEIKTLKDGRQYKDYHFNYLFTSKLTSSQENIANNNASNIPINLFDNSNITSPSAANLSNKKSKEVESLNSNITSLISLIQNFNPTGNKSNTESRQAEFSKLFTEKDKEIMKQILESKKFQSALTDKTFSINFADLISSLEPNIFDILVGIIESLSENAKKIYLNKGDDKKNNFGIKHLISVRENNKTEMQTEEV